MIKRFISYFVCLFSPKALATAVNGASTADELDGKIMEMAGFKNDKS